VSSQSLSTSGNAVTADNAGNDHQLLPLGFVGSFSKSHPTFARWEMLLWNRHQNIASSLSLSATFPLAFARSRRSRSLP
jgi:hypothetical protein